VRSTTGRRIGERRAARVPADPPQLPRRARRHAARLTFFERVEPPTEQAEDRDTARVVARIQAGDREAFGIIYKRYFARVYTYVRAVVPTKPDAEDVTQEVFAKLLAAMPRYERREQPFRAWLFTVVRNATVDHLEREGRMEPMEPEELDAIREATSTDEAPEPQELTALNWITDQDLMIFVERLPLAQRQVLVLRFLFGMKTAEIARTLGRSRTSVSTLQYRALEFLEERLTAIGRSPASNERGTNKMKAWGTPANVIRSRRFALWD
jgi:RNA polymerase sigma-70 factor (ECF subfamily)